MFSCFAPRETSRFRQASAAAPAPEVTILMSLDRLSGEFEPVEYCGGDDDRCAMLVVVEDGNAHARLQPFFDLEAFRRLDVLEIDAAKCRLQSADRFDHAVDLRRVDLDVEYIDAGELLEQHRLALHHRLGGQRADIAEAKNR